MWSGRTPALTGAGVHYSSERRTGDPAAAALDLASADHADQQEDDGDHQQDVQQTAERVLCDDPEQPQDQQDDDESDHATLPRGSVQEGCRNYPPPPARTASAFWSPSAIVIRIAARSRRCRTAGSNHPPGSPSAMAAGGYSPAGM